MLPSISICIDGFGRRTLPGVLCPMQEVGAEWGCKPEQRGHSSSQYQVFVKGLADDVDANLLLNAFRPYQCIAARIIWDRNTRRSKGYGFVQFR